MAFGPISWCATFSVTISLACFAFFSITGKPTFTEISKTSIVYRFAVFSIASIMNCSAMISKTLIMYSVTTFSDTNSMNCSAIISKTIIVYSFTTLPYTNSMNGIAFISETISMDRCTSIIAAIIFVVSTLCRTHWTQRIRVPA